MKVSRPLEKLKLGFGYRQRSCECTTAGFTKCGPAFHTYCFRTCMWFRGNLKLCLQTRYSPNDLRRCAFSFNAYDRSQIIDQRVVSHHLYHTNILYVQAITHLCHSSSPKPTKSSSRSSPHTSESDRRPQTPPTHQSPYHTPSPCASPAHPS